MKKYLEGARKRWLGEKEELVHRVGVKQFTAETVAWYRKQIFGTLPNDAFTSQTIVDYGCGVGRLLIPLSGYMGGYWYGVDISPDMIGNISLQEPYAENIAGLALTDGDGIPEGFLDDDTVDQIYSVITLQHVADHTVVRSILESFSRVLKKQGWFTIQVKKWREGLRPWNYVPPADGQPEPTGYDALPEHLQAEEGCAYTHEQIIQVCEDAGLYPVNTWETDPIDDHGTWIWVQGNNAS